MSAEPWKPILKLKNRKFVDYGKFAAAEYTRNYAPSNQYLEFKSVTQGGTRQVGSRFEVWLEIRATDRGDGGSVGLWRMNLYEEEGVKFFTNGRKLPDDYD
ncbi:phosphoglucosamine mutase [Striga asiatica]|uniref:Phosphoglucosamine mutase n=1 Tax=Striga asiatica TaxID=4170 RepID=A0A5A7RGG1_STRAF|nr:phosphoglucosamine mutase [Striga asiatica]